MNEQYDIKRNQLVGKIVYASGAGYDGEWKDNSYQGRGVYEFPDHTRLTAGEWTSNAVTGRATFEQEENVWSGDLSRGILMSNIEGQSSIMALKTRLVE